MKSFAVLVLALASTQGASAANDIPDARWNTSAELGAITTSGNTVGTSVTGKIDARQELAEWSDQFILSGYFKDDEHIVNGSRTSQRSAERYSVSAKAAYKLLQDGEKLFALGSHLVDHFGAYTSYSSLAIGHSTRWYKSDDKSVEVEIGPGYFSGTRASGEAESGVTVRGAAAMKWQLSPQALITQTLSVERGTSNVHSSAEAALSTKINGTMQMKAAFVTRSDSNVPADKKNTDTQTSLTLVYSF
ncbi:MAG: DUF481 domain-containing protein [Pseudomonadota bacterium]